MKNIILFLIGYIISFPLFYGIYKTLKVKEKIAGKKSVPYIVLLIILAAGFTAVSIADDFAHTEEYHRLFMGLFGIGPVASFLPFIFENNKNKVQEND